MKWKEQNGLSWCCVSRQPNDDDGDSKDANKQTTKVVLMQRSAEKVSLSIEKVKNRKEEKRKKEESTKTSLLRFPLLLFLLLLLVFRICAF